MDGEVPSGQRQRFEQGLCVARFEAAAQANVAKLGRDRHLYGGIAADFGDDRR